MDNTRGNSNFHIFSNFFWRKIVKHKYNCKDEEDAIVAYMYV